MGAREYVRKLESLKVRREKREERFRKEVSVGESENEIVRESYNH